MPRFDDWRKDKEIDEIVESLIDAFPEVFANFDLNQVFTIVTCGKKSRTPIRIRKIAYPAQVLAQKTYTMEVFEEVWRDLSSKKKRLAVFHAMCCKGEREEK